MSAIRAVVWKELRSFLRDEQRGLRTLWVGVLYVTLLTAFFNWHLKGHAFVLCGFIILVNGFLLTSTSFYKERVNKTIMNLLASPLSVRDIILGKLVAVFSVSYGVHLVVLLVSALVMWFGSEGLPSPSEAFIALFVIPVWTIVFIEFYAFCFLLFGAPLIFTALLMVIMAPAFSPALARRVLGFVSSPWLAFLVGVFGALILFLCLAKWGKERIVQALS